jgi:hypothetical protein
MRKFLVTKPRTFGKEKQPMPLREVGFMAITALTVFGPTVLLCMAMGQVWPLFLIAGTNVIGAGLGVAAHDRVNEPVLSCVPGATAAQATEQTDIINLKKAA